MARYCTQCGKETGDGRFCIHCGSPADHTQEVSQPVHLEPPSKKKRTGLTITIVLCTVVIVVALIGFGILSVLQTATQTRVTDAFVSTDTADTGTPAAMAVFSPDTRTVYLYGKADHLNDKTILELKWCDVTGEPVEFASVFATLDPETGAFSGEASLPIGDFQLAFSGDYRVDVYVNGGEEPDYTVSFSVHSDPPSGTVIPPVNDAYMVAEGPDGAYVPVSAYGPDMNMIVMLSFTEMTEDTEWRLRWLHETDGEWTVVQEDTDFIPVSEEPEAGLYLSGITPQDPWQPGDYRVEVYLSVSPDSPSAMVDYTADGTGAVSREIFFDEAVMTTGIDGDGYPVDEVTAYPIGTEAFYCSFYVGGISEPTELTWEWYNDSGVIAEPQSDTLEADTYYWVAFGETGDGVPFDPGNYRIVLRAGEAEYEVSFSVEDTTVALSSGSMPLAFDSWADWNGWLMTFTEGRLAPFNEGTPPDDDLIDFAVLYNYFYNEDMYATLDEYGMCWLSESALDYTVWWFLDTEVTPASTDTVMYEGGSYGYKAPEEEKPYHFPQVTKIYEHEDGGFVLEFDVYSAPVGFEDFNGDYDSWEAAGTVPEYLGEMRAWVRWAGEGDTDRRVLMSYETVD